MRACQVIIFIRRTCIVLNTSFIVQGILFLPSSGAAGIYNKNFMLRINLVHPVRERIAPDGFRILLIPVEIHSSSFLSKEAMYIEISILETNAMTGEIDDEQI